jgi:hypothetical protein
MRTFSWMGATLTMTLATIGCGGSAKPAASAGDATKPEVADSQHLTELQKSRLLGHYSTEDGKHGFVLDRTVTPPRARLDGEKAYEELTEQGSVTGAVEYTSPSKKIWLRVSKDTGDVMLFQGAGLTEGVSVVRDADAEQLK